MLAQELELSGIPIKNTLETTEKALARSLDRTGRSPPSDLDLKAMPNVLRSGQRLGGGGRGLRLALGCA